LLLSSKKKTTGIKITMPVNFSEEIPGPVTAILLASGFSKRFGGKNKLLIPFHGKALAMYALELAAGMDFSGGIFLVATSDEVAALAANLNAVRVIKNTAPEKGIRESIRLGVEAACTAYYLFFHCDQPFLDAATVQSILGARKPGFIVEPRCRGRPGNPCLFSAFFREELLSLGEGETPRLIKARYPEALRGVEVSSPLTLEDIDDEETFKRLSYSKRAGI
jgi:molybdenum cofactor cytidylyltransferase